MRHKTLLLLTLIALFCTPIYAIDPNTHHKHQDMLYPTVQFMGGSGIVIKSWNEEIIIRDGTKRTKNFAYAITANHVYTGYQLRSRTKKILPCRWYNYDELGHPIKRITTVGHLVVSDVELDIAIFKIQTGKNLFPVAKSYFTNQIALFDKVYSIGYPLGDLRIGVGHITRLPNKSIYLQHDTHIFYGNSGGPLFNKDYELIGINVQIVTWNGMPIPYMGKSALLYDIGLFLGEQRMEEYFGNSFKSDINKEI